MCEISCAVLGFEVLGYEERGVDNCRVGIRSRRIDIEIQYS